MFKGFYNLTSGMLTQGWKLDTISNNMTNVATSGFKADRFTQSTFENVMWSRLGYRGRPYTEIGQQSWITAPSQLYTDYSQASFDDTGMPLDFAIEGQGFFAVQTEEGRIYTRGGNFTLDDELYLCFPGQGRVLDTEGQPIQLFTDKIRADESGAIFTEDGAPLGRIGVFDFADYAQLEKNNLGFFTSEAQPQPAEVRVINGMLERSNVDLVQQMVSMIAAQRAYQSGAEVSKIYDSVMRTITNDVGRMS